MAAVPDLHYCQICGVFLGPENGDGLCAPCDIALVDQEDYDELAAREE